MLTWAVVAWLVIAPLLSLRKSLSCCVRSLFLWYSQKGDTKSSNAQGENTRLLTCLGVFRVSPLGLAVGELLRGQYARVGLSLADVVLDEQDVLPPSRLCLAHNNLNIIAFKSE